MISSEVFFVETKWNFLISTQVCQACNKELDRLSVGFKDTKGMEAKYLDYSSLNNVFSFEKSDNKIC